MTYQSKLMRFCNKKNCQSFGHIVAPADRHLYPSEPAATFFDEKNEKIDKKYVARTVYPNFNEHYLRIRPLDWVSYQFARRVEKRYLYRGRNVVSSTREPLNFWTESDDNMVDAIVQRLADGDTARPISVCNLPTLGQLFRNCIKDCFEENLNER